MYKPAVWICISVVCVCLLVLSTTFKEIGWSTLLFTCLLGFNVIYFTFKRAEAPPLSKRKERLWTYFIYCLGVDERVANALWRADPWMAGPGESTPEEMKTFARQLVNMGVERYHLPKFHWPYTAVMNWMQFYVYEGNGILCIMVGDLRTTTIMWKWYTDGTLKRSSCRGMGAWLEEQQWVNFHAFRTDILDCLEARIKSEKI
jgi:hypothetical protein